VNSTLSLVAVEAMQVLRARGWSYPEIGQAFSVHHTTVMYHLDPYFRARKLRLAKRPKVAA
jgi:DNA-directed RNA polymerase specialized sigma24 family protein